MERLAPNITELEDFIFVLRQISPVSNPSNTEPDLCLCWHLHSILVIVLFCSPAGTS